MIWRSASFQINGRRPAIGDSGAKRKILPLWRGGSMAGICPAIASATKQPAWRCHFLIRYVAKDQLADCLGARQLSLVDPEHFDWETDFYFGADRCVNGGHESPSMMDVDCGDREDCPA
jgi:hypothetical protein